MTNRKKYFFSAILLLLGSISFSQSLDDLLKEVVEQNPDLKSLNAQFEAERSRVDQVSQLPNLSLGSGVPAMRPETRLGPQLVMVSASQMFPWFGTFRAKEEVVISMSKAKFEKIAAKKLDLFFRLKAAYYEINFQQTISDIIKERLEIYRSLENISLTKVESGLTLISDVLRLQVKIQELEEEIPKISNDIQILETQINEITHHDFSRKIETENVIDTIIPLNFDTAAYMNKISKYHPMIAALNYKIEASENAQQANKKMNSVIFGVGVDYSLVGQRTDANPLNNGRDILVPKMMLSVPLYRKSYHAKDTEEEFLQESLNYQKEAFLDAMMSQLLQYKLEYDNAVLMINLHQNQYETTEKALEILMVNYSSTGQGFDEVLQLENQLLSHEIAVVQGKFKMKMAIAKIDRLTDF